MKLYEHVFCDGELVTIEHEAVEHPKSFRINQCGRLYTQVNKSDLDHVVVLLGGHKCRLYSTKNNFQYFTENVIIKLTEIAENLQKQLEKTSKNIETLKKIGENSKIHLCDSCINSFPTCDSKEIEFGNGYGNDNVINCDKYKRGENV